MKRRQADTTKIVLATIFMSVLGLMVQWVKPIKLSAYDVLSIVFATLRLSRMIAFDKVFEPYRRPIAVTKPDESGAGDTTAPRQKNGIILSLGQLITCPICIGTWIAAGLVYGLHLIPKATRLFLMVFSTIGMVEVLNDLTESLSWTGQAARQKAGKE